MRTLARLTLGRKRTDLARTNTYFWPFQGVVWPEKDLVFWPFQNLFSAAAAPRKMQCIHGGAATGSNAPLLVREEGMGVVAEAAI